MALVADRKDATLHSHDNTPARHGDEGVSRPLGAATTPLVSRAIERARSGDRAAFGFLYARYAEDIYEDACAIAADEAQARALTQRVFAGLQCQIERYEERDAPFGMWIRRLARDLATNEAT